MSRPRRYRRYSCLLTADRDVLWGALHSEAACDRPVGQTVPAGVCQMTSGRRVLLAESPTTPGVVTLSRRRSKAYHDHLLHSFQALLLTSVGSSILPIRCSYAAREAEDLLQNVLPPTRALSRCSLYACTRETSDRASFRSPPSSVFLDLIPEGLSGPL